MFEESREMKKKRAGEILKRLRKKYPEVRTALRHDSPLQMLVATILSAQCLDQTVNEVTPALFDKYPTAEAYAKAKPGELEALIRPTGFFRNKTKSLIGMGQALVEKHGGKVPETMEELVQIPGVARKTANVVLQEAIRPQGPHEGVVVDTHVRRVAYRLGLTAETVPEKIEQDLMALTPRKYWRELGMTMIWHGRDTCVARRPKCSQCVLEEVCPKIGV
ncbi:MAG: endonuclease III [candidate division WS1 bacterium]|jgi:endonuclease-3|nr:endonuclease III [candidate division WS1 bacterium]